jgi:glucan phosphoethanolaminetransferase (alkaline phosphatase superfamily)
LAANLDILLKCFHGDRFIGAGLFSSRLFYFIVCWHFIFMLHFMSKQDYSNHIRFYYPHHFIFYPLVTILAIICGYKMVSMPEERLLFGSMLVMLLIITWVAFMMRQHYALNNQNRIVRLEMRLRYYQLTGNRLEQYEQQLSFGQIAALRFASDAEMPSLLERAIKEKLTPDAIKRAIVNWLPDEMRA